MRYIRTCLLSLQTTSLMYKCTTIKFLSQTNVQICPTLVVEF